MRRPRCQHDTPRHEVLRGVRRSAAPREAPPTRRTTSSAASAPRRSGRRRLSSPHPVLHPKHLAEKILTSKAALEGGGWRRTHDKPIRGTKLETADTAKGSLRGTAPVLDPTWLDEAEAELAALG